jgi:O-antigen ligase
LENLLNILKGEKAHFWIPILVSVFFLGLSTYFLQQDKLVFAVAVPFVLVVVYWVIFKIDYFFYLLAITIPLSASLEEFGIYTSMAIDISLPAEPILVFLLGVSFYKFFFYFDDFRGMRKHPIFIALLVYLLAMLFSVVTSEMPLVAIKSFISKWWFIFPVVILGYQFFKKDRNYHQFLLLLSVFTSIVVLYSVVRLASKGFELHYAHFVMQPFYKDHTVYGASITFVMFLSFFQIFQKNISVFYRFIYILTTVVLLIGIGFSYTRAAWVSIIAAIGVWFLIKARIPFKYVLGLGLILGTTVYSYWDDIYFALNKNSQDSSGNITEHINSMSNISTDASNVERLNRWFCAIELWKEKPITGWGPGTYQFEYGRFQKSYSRSLISTNDGNLGNAHSEFLGSLADSGVIGFLGLAILLYVFFSQSIKLYYRVENPDYKYWVMAAILGNASYFTHGILNNYLDTEKVAVFVWLAFSIIIIIDNKDRKAIS